MHYSPPFATPTLARLYLQQGHLEQARAIVNELGRSGQPVKDLEEALWKSDEARTTALSLLLVRVQERRRAPGSGN